MKKIKFKNSSIKLLCPSRLKTVPTSVTPRIDPKHAVLNAVYLHGACAELWTDEHSAHTLLAHELSDILPRVWKRFE